MVERKQRTTQQPATTPEGQESQLVAKAMKLAAKQLDDGTASAQVVTHYLKLGSSREQLEQSRLQNENAVLLAKIKQMESATNVELLYENAIAAMRGYRGDDPVESDDE